MKSFLTVAAVLGFAAVLTIAVGSAGRRPQQPGGNQPRFDELVRSDFFAGVAGTRLPWIALCDSSSRRWKRNRAGPMFLSGMAPDLSPGPQKHSKRATRRRERPSGGRGFGK